MKILIICDHYPLSPRVLKMRNSIKKIIKNAEVVIFCWNRKDFKVKESFVYSYSQDIGYKNKSLKVISLFKFYIALKRFLKFYKPDYLHAIDFSMLVAGSLIKSNRKLIYEVYDIKFIKNRLLNVIREIFEKNILNRKVDGILFASPFFQKYYKHFMKPSIKSITINNKPMIGITEKTTAFMENLNIKLKNKFVIGFIGNIRHEVILLNLIKAVKLIDNSIVLLAGDGIVVESLKKQINYLNLDNKVIFTGRYTIDDTASIYKSCDVIWAAYPNDNLNVKYAISNKYFESIIFHKKIIVSENTYLADIVQKERHGRTVDPYSVSCIADVLTRVKEEKIDEIQIDQKQKKLFWEYDEVKLNKIYNMKNSLEGNS